MQGLKTIKKKTATWRRESPKSTKHMERYSISFIILKKSKLNNTIYAYIPTYKTGKTQKTQ